MVIELFGGPLDGAIIDASADLPLYVVIHNHQEGPIYRAGVGISKSRCAPYIFLGYEQMIRYEYPEKSQNIKSIEQKDVTVSDTFSGA